MFLNRLLNTDCWAHLFINSKPERDLKICISNQFLGDGDVFSSKIMLRNTILY